MESTEQTTLREMTDDEMIRVIRERLLYGEKLARDSGLLLTMETMKHIALFCGAGAAAAFTAMQVQSISMPLVQSFAGLFFLAGFGLSVFHLHLNAVHCVVLAELYKKRWAESLNDENTISYIDSPIADPETTLKMKKKVEAVGWSSAIAGVIGACLLVLPVITKELWKIFS